MDCVVYGSQDPHHSDIMKRVLTLFDDQSRRYENLPPKWRSFKYDWHDFKYFVVAFAYQMMLPGGEGFQNSKQIYKKAIRRSECPLGAFNMLVSIYLTKMRSKPRADQLQYLRKKVASLKRLFEVYLSYDAYNYNGIFTATLNRLEGFMNEM